MVTACIDDTASTAPPDKAERWFAVLTSTLVGHGLRCNEAKSAPPAPSLEHVGLVFGPDRERVSLLPARQHMVERLSTVLAGGKATLEVWRSVAGRLRATSPALGRRLGADMYGAWGFLREFRCGCTDAKGIGGRFPDLAFTLEAVQRLAVASKKDRSAPGPQPRDTAGVAICATDASETGTGAVVGWPGGPVRTVAARLGAPHGPETSSSEREILGVVMGVAAAVELAREQARTVAVVVAATDNQGCAACIRRGAGMSYTARVGQWPP